MLNFLAPVAGAAIGGTLGGPAGAAVGYGIGSSVTASQQNKENMENQKSANKQNIALAREQMNFQERMSNSAYQRGMEDMKKAGLNPMLAFQQGGASQPSGALGQVNPVENRMAEMTHNSAQSAIQLANMATDMDMKETQSDLQRAQAKKTLAETTKIKKTAPIDELQHDAGTYGKQLLEKLKGYLKNSSKDAKPTKPEVKKMLQRNYNPDAKPFKNLIH